MSNFRLHPGLKVSFERNSDRKELFMSAYFCWDFRLSLLEVDQKIKLGGSIGCGESYLGFLFRHFKAFRLHAKLHDAAGAVQAYSGKDPGYCYMSRRGPNSCLLGQVNGLLFCLYVKLFLPSIFSSVDCRRSMSLLDTEVADINAFKQLKVFIHGKVQRYQFRSAEKYKPTKQDFLHILG